MFFRDRQLNKKEIVGLLGYLPDLIKSGLQLPKALNVLEEGAQGKLKKIYRNIRTDLETGIGFSGAIEPYMPERFSSTIRVGEESGRLVEVMEDMRDSLEEDLAIRSEIIGNLTYPGLVMGMMLCIGVYLMLFMLPSVAESLGKIGTITSEVKTMLALSQAMRKNWHLMLLAAVAVVFVLRGLAKYTTLKARLEWYSFNIPRIGMLLKKLYATRFFRELAFLLRSGVLVTEAVGLAAHATGSSVWKQAGEQIVSDMRRGMSFSAAFTANIIDYLGVTYIQIGEESSRLDEYSRNLSDIYRKDTIKALKLFVKLTEPAMLIMIASGIATLVFYLIIPIYESAMKGF